MQPARLWQHRRIPQAKQAFGFQRRHASLTGAIARGARRSQFSAERERSRDNDLNDEPDGRQPSSYSHNRRDAVSRGPDRVSYRPSRVEDDDGCLIEVPRTTPYTKADSEFVYGLHAVDAAIRFNRRQIHKLYVYFGEDGGRRSQAEIDLYNLATRSKVEIVKVKGPGWKQKMSQLANGRAHNGFILEASPIPIPIMTSLQEVEYAGASWTAKLASATERATYEPKADNRFPFLLMLDSINDAGNVGAIVRTAYYFGVDGILRPELGATNSGAMLKAAAGAGEAFPFFTIRDDAGFIREAQDNGWHVATAIAPDAQVRLQGGRGASPAIEQTPGDILKSKSLVLIVGNEGEGVRPKLSRLSDSFMTIQDAPGLHTGVDSLNVSVASAILMHHLLSPFLPAPRTTYLKGRKVVRPKTHDSSSDIF